MNTKDYKEFDDGATSVIKNCEVLKMLIAQRKSQNKLDVVVCDDDAIDLEAFEKACSECGLTVRAVLTAEECLKEIDTNDISILILDYYIGTTTALELLEKNKKEFNYPVFVYTGYELPDDIMSKLKEKNVVVYPKHISPSSLMTIIKRYL